MVCEGVGCGDVGAPPAEALGKAAVGESGCVTVVTAPVEEEFAVGEAAGCVAVVAVPVEEEFAVLFEKENPDCKLETVKVFA